MQTNDEVPAGFTVLEKKSPLTEPWAPIYARQTTDALHLAIRVRECHCNSRGFVHGGLIGALADWAMGMSCGVTAKNMLHGKSGDQSVPTSAVTVNLVVDFIAATQIGAWLEFQPRVLKLGRSLGFVDCIVQGDGKLVARASATFKFG